VATAMLTGDRADRRSPRNVSIRARFNHSHLDVRGALQQPLVQRASELALALVQLEVDVRLPQHLRERERERGVPPL
jgi:hypothetical protein